MLEVVVARTNFMAKTTARRVRVIGLSTALANAADLADWLEIDEVPSTSLLLADTGSTETVATATMLCLQVGFYNFRPAVRPVPTEVHIAGFAGKHYCPRMATMNKPAYQGPHSACNAFESCAR